MKTMTKLLLAAVLASLSLPAAAGLRIFACEPEWAWLAAELGGDAVDVYAATTGLQDVHFIQARPSLISKLRRADLVVCTGADLEAGWLPVLLRQGGNAGVQPGRPGFFEASDYVDMLEVPASVDRSQGDVHPFGNPHIQLDPRNIARVADALAGRMAQLDPADEPGYRARQQAFSERWEAALGEWEARAAALAGMAVVTHHRSWIYLVDWLDLDEVANLEPQPGIEPGAGHLADLLAQIEGRDVRVIIRAAYQSPRASEWLSRRSGILAVVLPHTVGSVAGTDDMYAVFETIITILEANHGETGR
jgi:zinc/manganese transport system substrate-binding protein